MAIFTILYGNYYPPHGELNLICIGKFARLTWGNFTQQYGKNRQRCQKINFTMLYGNCCYIFIENFPRKYAPYTVGCWKEMHLRKKAWKEKCHCEGISNAKECVIIIRIAVLSYNRRRLTLIGLTNRIQCLGIH